MSTYQGSRFMLYILAAGTDINRGKIDWKLGDHVVFRILLLKCNVFISYFVFQFKKNVSVYTEGSRIGVSAHLETTHQEEVFPLNHVLA